MLTLRVFLDTKSIRKNKQQSHEAKLQAYKNRRIIINNATSHKWFSWWPAGYDNQFDCSCYGSGLAAHRCCYRPHICSNCRVPLIAVIGMHPPTFPCSLPLLCIFDLFSLERLCKFPAVTFLRFWSWPRKLLPNLRIQPQFSLSRLPNDNSIAVRCCQ